MKKISLVGFFFLCLIGLSLTACGGDDNGAPVETPPVVPGSTNSGADGSDSPNPPATDFEIGGKWEVISINGVSWETLSFAESTGYIVFEKNGTYTTRKGGYHLLNLSGTSRYSVSGNKVEVYNNGNVATFAIEKFANNQATVKLTQNNSTRTVVLEKQPLITINTYLIKFDIPSYSKASNYNPTWYLYLQNENGERTDISTFYVSDRTTNITYRTGKSGYLRAWSKMGTTECDMFFKEGGVPLEPGESQIYFSYWVWVQGRGYQTESTNATLTISVLNSETSYDDEDETENQPQSYTSYFVSVTLAASAEDISGCTFKYYLDSQEAIIGKPETWYISKSATLKISTYVGSRLIGSTSTQLEAQHEYSTEVQFYDKNKKLQTGYAFVTGN